MSNVLEVKNVSKSFKDYRSESQRILSWFGLKSKPIQEHQILKHINLSLSPGEAVGLVGQNGAGKSTLLKIITGTLKPSQGSVHIAGRISAILELGMGFHPDLTGRQNVYHSAGLMGFTQAQIDAVIDELEAFAEIGEYFDQPVRTYSSGMQMRVAFGVVTAYRPEILIVDEALSVGDAYFQHKSLNRIREFQEQGTTLLLVSHDRASIQAICDRAILLEKGAVIKDGNPEEVMDFYNALIAEKENSTVTQTVKEDGKVETVSGTNEATVEEIGLYNTKGEMVEFVGVGDALELRIKVKIHQDIESLVLGYGIKDRLGQVMYGTNTWHTKQVIESPVAGNVYEFIASFPANLGPGSYSIQTALTDQDTHLTKNYEWRDLTLVFNVVNSSKQVFAGSVWLDQKIEVKHVS
ncbi:ABC transporter ATP-binding protein [Psychromonas aquimarina]|uniref:ABC transporter ATP-binding protein n=1 Tax=Psychromonas aquimarina TaxID=444919 RepID=UPI00042757E5|nr:ABC transporter ATP-binding protein [Psychromonas aquimarina]